MPAVSRPAAPSAERPVTAGARRQRRPWIGGKGPLGWTGAGGGTWTPTGISAQRIL